MIDNRYIDIDILYDSGSIIGHDNYVIIHRLSSLIFKEDQMTTGAIVNA
jgi:hypothetical protein